MGSKVETRTETVKSYYESLQRKHKKYRKALGRPLTLGEKILFSHLEKDDHVADLVRGESFLHLKPARVSMQDATAQMALLQFIQSGKKEVAVPSTVHCDHLILAHSGVEEDMKASMKSNEEVFTFLKTASQKYGIGFWGPGSGIIHQVVLENYAFPGALIIGTDSHTPNGGGLGMLAIGVGGADAVDVMAGMSWELLNPQFVGVHLTGQFRPWASPKDVILKALEILTVKGGTNRIIEYFGPGAAQISCTGKATITNMGAELGATTSVFPFDSRMADYLRETQREKIADLAEHYQECLRPDPEVEKDPSAYYDQVIEINLDELEPYIVGPHSPDKARPVSKLKKEITKEGYPANISACLVGSCTNSSYEDIYKAAQVAKEAMDLGFKSKVPFWVSPGSMQIFATIKRDGLLKTLEDFGGTVLANACGPCIGQWKRDDIKDGESNSIVTSFNRNFRGRNDANAETLGFITSPELVVAYAITGDLGFDPGRDGVGPKKTLLTPPTAPDLPSQGFVKDRTGYLEPPKDRDSVEVSVAPSSKRLQILAPFEKREASQFQNNLLLVKVRGKCTTDHISPAGKWLRFRGHLQNISDNMLIGANNAFFDKPGQGLNQLSNQHEGLSQIATQYQDAGHGWVIVGDDNYGEGSSREHAAMSPRYLGGTVVLVKSFARIHETNLKKQGMLGLTFADPKDYDRIQEKDHLSIQGLESFEPQKNLTVNVKHSDGSEESFEACHSYNAEQIQWFFAGSALNLIS